MTTIGRPARFRLTATLLLLAVALMLSANVSQRTQAQSENDSGPRQFNVVILLDESGSMWTDTDKEVPDIRDPLPIDQQSGFPLYTQTPARIAAVQSLLTAMSGEWGDAQFNTAIIAFGSEATTIVGVQPAATNFDTNIKRLWDHHISVKNSLIADKPQYTNTRDALRLAHQLLYDDRGDALYTGTNVVLMISDGVPDTTETVASSDPNVRAALYEEVRTEIDDLTNLKARFISMILSTNPDSKHVNYEFWANVATQVAGNLSTGGVSGDSSCGFWQINSADVLGNNALGVLQCLLGNPPPGPNPPPLDPTHREGVYGVEEYANELLITINKNNPSIAVEVLRPGATTPIRASSNDQGDTVEHTSSGLSEGYHIKHNSGSSAPWAGCWTIRMSAQAPTIPDARVDFISITSGDYVLKFNKPASPVWPVGKPLPLAVGVYSNTQQLVDPRAVTLDPTMSLVITSPVRSQTLNLTAKGAVYEGQYRGNTITGTYTLAASINSTQMHPPSSATANCPNTNAQAGKLIRTLPLDVRLIPWVDLVEPSPDGETPSSDLQVRARVMTGTDVLKLAPGDTVQVDVELDKGDGSQPKSFRLRSDPNNPAEFSGKPAAGTVLDSGTYTLTAVLLSKVGGKSTTDTTQAHITLRQTQPTATVSSSTPTPTIPVPCADPNCPKPPEFPLALVLGVAGVGGALVLGLLLLRMLASTAKMDGVALTTFTGDTIPLSGTKQVKDLSGASVRFTASPTSGQPSMQVVSTGDDPVMLNGMEQPPGSPATQLSDGDNIQVGSETYTVGGTPRSARRSKRSRATSQPEDFGFGDPNYGNMDNFGNYDDSKNQP